jgi:UDP-glucose 4-epimerase
MKILVTGGAGFIGSHTVVELYNAGHEPVILDNLNNSDIKVLDGIKAILGNDVKFYSEDSNNINSLRNIFKTEKFDGVIHFAAHKAVNESVFKPLEYYENNLGSLIKILQVMQEYNVSNFVFSSSCTVYGQPDVLPVTENTPRKQATSPYGNTKAIGEDIIADQVRAQYGLKAISLRYFNPIGAHPSAQIGELPLGIPSNLVPFITQTAAGIRDCLTIFGDDYNTPDGSCVRDFIHVIDLAKAHIKALELLDRESENNYYDVFNVGTGTGNTVLELIKTFEEVNNLQLNYKMGKRREGDIEKIYAQADKISQVLGWKPEKTLAEGLKDAWRWQQHLNNRK